MSRFLYTALLALVMTVSSQAAIVTFDFTTLGNGVLGDPATVSQASMSSGVNYTANLQLDGSGTILTDSNGLGLITGSTFEINNTESLLFTMSPTTAVSGGLATFNGFTSISFTEFDAGDSAEINGTSVNSNGTLGLANVATINAIGTGDADPPNAGFQISQITADFTITPSVSGVSAVPEPSSFAALLLIGGMAINRRRRRD